MDGEVPGAGPNGTFTHPLVVANQVDQVLAAGDAALSEDQSDRLSAITNHYLAQDENLRVVGLTPEQRQSLLQNNGVMVPLVR